MKPYADVLIAWAQESAAEPVAWTQPEIDAAKERAESRAAVLGFPTTNQPEVTLEDDIASFSATDAANTPVGKRILASLQRLQRIEAGLREPSDEMCEAASTQILPSYEGQLDHQCAYDIVSAEDMKVIFKAMSAILLRGKP